MNEHEKARAIAEGIADKHLGPHGAELEDDITAALQAERERCALALDTLADKTQARANAYFEVGTRVNCDRLTHDATTLRLAAAAIRGEG